MNPQRSLALIISSRPFARRAARTELDVALAAAALDMKLDIYFAGEAVLQLLARRNPSAAGFPQGHRAWAALPDLAELRVYADAEWLDRCSERGLDLVLPVRRLDRKQRVEGWRQFRHAIVI